VNIYYSSELKSHWPKMAKQWLNQYPMLFDKDDLRLTVTQPWTHFFEWYVAIHLYQRFGVYSLLEKYGCKSHSRKLKIFNELTSVIIRRKLDAIQDKYNVQLPDLLVYKPDLKTFWFTEVKGNTDTLKHKQIDSHRDIIQQLRIPVNIINVLPLD